MKFLPILLCTLTSVFADLVAVLQDGTVMTSKSDQFNSVKAIVESFPEVSISSDAKITISADNYDVAFNALSEKLKNEGVKLVEDEEEGDDNEDYDGDDYYDDDWDI